MRRSVIHALTPGDHFSPKTGSAIPTVVDGLASAARGDELYTHQVLLEESTMRPRYASADAIEYVGAGYPVAWERAVDLALSRVGLPRVRTRRSYRPLVEALGDQPPGIIVAHNAPTLPAMLRSTPHVSIYYAHNDLPRGMSRREASRAMDPAASIVAVSSDLAARIADRVAPSIGERIRVVENGVDVEAFHPAPRPGGAAPARVMFVGRVVAEKGPDVLLRAAALLGRRDLEVMIVGSQGFDAAAAASPYEESLRALATDLPGPVTFQPFVDRSTLPGLLQTADVFVVPSRWAEPSGLTVGEAMATGIPVIATDSGGIAGVLGDAGILVPADDPERLAQALSSLIDDPAERARLAARARSRAEARSWDLTWAQLRRVLVEATG